MTVRHKPTRWPLATRTNPKATTPSTAANTYAHPCSIHRKYAVFVLGLYFRCLQHGKTRREMWIPALLIDVQGGAEPSSYILSPFLSHSFSFGDFFVCCAINTNLSLCVSCVFTAPRRCCGEGTQKRPLPTRIRIRRRRVRFPAEQETFRFLCQIHQHLQRHGQIRSIHRLPEIRDHYGCRNRGCNRRRFLCVPRIRTHTLPQFWRATDRRGS